MVCDFDSLLKVLPAWLAPEVNRLGRQSLQELRLRLDQPPELIIIDGRQWLRQAVRQEDLNFCFNAASRYSPWNTASAAKGYLTIQGGHRMGICGEVTLKEGQVLGIRRIRSLSIRVARDFPGIADGVGSLPGSILILGAPGWGKTTLLRDLIRQRSQIETVAVVDEREELFPEGFGRGLQADILTGCPKAQGILQLLRTMGPQSIAVDEITAEEDCRAVLEASRCGVNLLATAHAVSPHDLRGHALYGPLVDARVFDSVLLLSKDRTYQVERVKP